MEVRKLVKLVRYLVLLLIFNICIPLVSQSKVANENYGYLNLGLCKSLEETAAIYEKTSTDSKVVGVLPVNAGCEVLYNAGDWIYVSSGDVDGFIPANNLYIGNKAWDKAVSATEYIATAKKNGIKVRKTSSNEAEVLYSLIENETLVVVDDSQNEKWIKVEISDNIFGYVRNTDVTIDNTLRTAITEDELTRRASVK